jgi:hypothetical protein
VEQCGKALTKATQTLVAGLETQLAGCAQKVFACLQAKSQDLDCLSRAMTDCDRRDTKISKNLFAKFAANVEKNCGMSIVSFDRLAEQAGLYLRAVTTPCAPGASDPVTAFGNCLQQRVQCSVARSVRHAIPRIEAFNGDALLGELSDDFAMVCPSTPSPTPAVSSLVPGRGTRLGVFGSIFKFVKQIQRAGVDGMKKSGAPPASSPGANRGVIKVGGPVRVTFGAITKVPFTYRLWGLRTRASRAELAEEPPTLIVAVQGEDLTSADYFEVALDPTAPGEVDIQDELELTYQDSFPGCAFTLLFATRVGSEVSEYTPVLQVVDSAQSPVTPTATPTPTPAKTATATLAGATSTRTPTPTATGITPTPTPTGTPPGQVLCNEGVVGEPITFPYGSDSTSCEIILSSDIDTFAFVGTVGDDLRIVLTGTSRVFDPRLEVRDPDGVRIADASCAACNNGSDPACTCSLSVDSLQAGNRFLKVLDKTGRYIVSVSDDNATDTGSYNLSIQCLSGLCL